MASLSTRPFREGDQEAVARLYLETFATAVGAEYWQWKYLRNPSGQVWIELAFDGDRCVGQYAMLPVLLSVRGETTPTLVALDNMVHPDYQRRGILKKLEAGLAARRPNDIPYYTFVNENSYPMYVKHFGWTWMGPLGVFMKPLGVDSLARRFAPLRLLSPAFAAYRSLYGNRANPLNATAIDDFDDGIAELWERNKARYGVTFDRSLRNLRWRFLDAPVAYEKYALRDASGLRGYAVVRIEEKFGLKIGWFLDLFLDAEAATGAGGGPALFSDALRAVEQHLLGRCDFLSMIAPAQAWERSCRRAGFRRVPSRLLPHQFYFCVRGNNSPHAAVLDREAWYFTWSLHDVL
jgi:GNAT superfamily N-acetyltransferase